MVTIIPTRPITDAILARIQGSVQCGDADKPPSVPSTSQGLPQAPYATLYPLSDDDAGGALADPRQWAWIRYQVTVVGGSRQQAEVGQGLVRTQLLGWTPTVTGWRCGPVELSDGSGVERDDDPTPPLFYTTDQFRLYVTAG